MKLVYKIIGISSLATGLIGVFVPLLPTTCFVLLAAWCFSKSSPRLYALIKQNRFVGQSLNDWEKHRSMPLTAQRFAISSMLLSGLICLITIDNFVVKLSALILISIGIWFVSQIPTTKPTKLYSENALIED